MLIILNGDLKNDMTLTKLSQIESIVMVSKLFSAQEDFNSADVIYSSLVNSSVEANNGKPAKDNEGIVKSLFNNSFDAVSAGIALQEKIDDYNMENSLGKPILLASVIIGTEAFHNKLNRLTNVSIDGALADGSCLSCGEIFTSEDVFKIFEGNSDFNFRMEKELTESNWAKPFRLYKVLFDKHEIGAEKNRLLKSGGKPDDTQRKSRLRIISTAIAVPAFIVIMVTLMSWYTRDSSNFYKQHSITHIAYGKSDGK